MDLLLQLVGVSIEYSVKFYIAYNEFLLDPITGFGSIDYTKLLNYLVPNVNSPNPTLKPTKQPQLHPTHPPTRTPRISPTKSPRINPTHSPARHGSASPTKSPRSIPTRAPHG